MTYYLCAASESICPAAGLPEDQRYTLWCALGVARAVGGQERIDTVREAVEVDLTERGVPFEPQDVVKLAMSAMILADGGCQFDIIT